MLNRNRTAASRLRQSMRGNLGTALLVLISVTVGLSYLILPEWIPRLRGG